jgi:hypothetical protein
MTDDLYVCGGCGETCAAGWDEALRLSCAQHEAGHAVMSWVRFRAVADTCVHPAFPVHRRNFVR